MSKFVQKRAGRKVVYEEGEKRPRRREVGAGDDFSGDEGCVEGAEEEGGGGCGGCREMREEGGVGKVRRG